MQTMVGRRGWGAFSLLLIGAALALGVFWGSWLPAHAQQGLFYDGYDVEMTLHDDGSFTVRSRQSIRFDDVYNTAFLEIPTEHAANIRVTGVWQEAPRFTTGAALQPLDFTTSQAGDTLFVDWEYDDTVPNETRTFLVEYLVEGSVWVYDDFDVLQWFAIHADRSGLPIYDASVTLVLPEAVANAAAEGMVTASVVSGNGEASIQGDRVFFVPDGVQGGALADGEGFEIALEFPHGLLPIAMPEWQRAAAEAEAVVRIPAFDVQMAIQPDGRLDITEDVEVAVDEGAIYSGYRTINLLFQDEIQNVRVYQDGRPLPHGAEGCDFCYTTQFTPANRSWARWNPATAQVEIDEEDVGRMEIRWWTPAIDAGETSEFSVRYTVLGGIRTDDDAQVINFDALPDYDLPIQSATLQIVPPAGVDPGSITAESPTAQSDPEITAAGAILLRNEAFDPETLTTETLNTGSLPATRARWEVIVTMPPDATAATTPQWQQQFEQALATGQAQAAAQARRTLGARMAGLLAIVAAIGAAVWGWLRFGRQRANEMLKGYVAEPPSTLAPGIVAYLLDRKTSEKGVLASLFHLAAAGVLDIDLSSGIQIRRLVAEPVKANATLRNRQGEAVRIEDHQAALVNDVLIPNAPLDQFVTLDALAPALRGALPEIFAKMGKDAQEYFLSSSPASPGRGCLWTLAALFGLVAAFFLVAWSGFDGPTFTFVATAGVALGVLAIVYAMRRPFGGQRRSRTGEAEAEKWIKFRNYLLNLKEYGDLGAAQEIVDRHFAYAVALGTERVVLAQAESMGASLPPWIPIPTHHPYEVPHSAGGSSGGSATQPPAGMEPRPLGQPMPAPVAASQPQSATPRPSLTGMSAAMGESLATGSRNLGRTLSVATGGAAASTVVLKSALKQRTMQFDANTTPNRMLDDIMRQSLSDARTIISRPTPTTPSGSPWSGGRSASGGSSGGSGGGSFWEGSSSGSSRSSGGFGGSSSSWSSGSSSRSSSSSSSSSSSRSSSSGGGRSGFGKR